MQVVDLAASDEDLGDPSKNEVRKQKRKTDKDKRNYDRSKHIGRALWQTDTDALAASERMQPGEMYEAEYEERLSKRKPNAVRLK